MSYRSWSALVALALCVPSVAGATPPAPPRSPPVPHVPDVRPIGNGKHFTVVVPRPKDVPSVYEIARRRGLPTTHENLRAIIEEVSFDDAMTKGTSWATAHGVRLQGQFRAFNFHDVADVRSSIAARQSGMGKPSPDGWSDVHIHGDPTEGLQEEKANGTRVTYTPAQFAAELRRRGYDGGPVRLISCQTGARVTVGVNTAQQVANALGAPVVAASEDTYTYGDGHITTQNERKNPITGKMEPADFGRWRVFVPAPSAKNGA